MTYHDEKLEYVIGNGGDNAIYLQIPKPKMPVILTIMVRFVNECVLNKSDLQCLSGCDCFHTTGVLCPLRSKAWVIHHTNVEFNSHKFNSFGTFYLCGDNT